MPEPQSAKANVITEATYEAPFGTPVFTFGMGGVRLDCALDAIPPNSYARLTNGFYTAEGAGEILTRPGLTEYANGAGLSSVHSEVRLSDPTTSTVTRVWGIGSAVYMGASGALAATDSGYSGNPLHMITYRPPLSSAPYVFVGDRSRNRKIRSDGLVLPIGLPAPPFNAGAALAGMVSVPVIPWTGATAYANWTGNIGFTYSDPLVATDPSEVVFYPNAPNGDLAGGFVTRTTPARVIPSDPTAPVPNPYYGYWGVPTTMNLAVLGAVAASDDDLFHLWLNYSHTENIEEFRIYLVCSAVFSPSIIPGLPNDTNANTDFYLKAFSANDFASFIQTTATQLESAERARVHTVRDQSVKESSQWTGRVLNSQLPNAMQQRRASLDPIVTITPQASAGSGQWIEFGVVGNPLRRGDFQRIGTTVGRDWSTITGIVTFVRVKKDAQDVMIALGSMYLHGGSGPDSTDAGDIPYDYRYTHYDPRTGAEGNPSPEMLPANAVDAARRALIVVTQAYGDAAVRQRIYRRGGTLTDDWYYVGQNASDGGLYGDVLADTAIVAAGTVALDHYAAVPSTNAAGTAVLGQPVSCFFGPYNGQIFGLGDPNRPGFIYACLPDQPDLWPPDLAHEVCSPSEELLTGFLYGGQLFVFSTQHLFAVYPNLTGVNGMSSTPTGCTRGPVSPWAVAVGAGAIWFVASDGVFRTQGGPEDRITGSLQPLFDGESRYGYLPPDFTLGATQRLCVFDNELWWSYQDSAGTYQQWIYQIPTGFWRHYTFSIPVNAVMLDAGNPTETLFIGGVSDSTAYTHTGFSDAGSAIAVTLQTGASNFGHPREEKLFGDQMLDLDGNGTDLTLQNAFNLGTVINAVQSLTGAGDGTRAIFDSFGIIPQRARDITTTIEWSTDSGGPVLRRLGVAITRQPDLTVNRVTNWDDLQRGDESYVMGVTLDADTGGEDRIIHFERDWDGQISIMHTEVINHDGRHKYKYSWPARQANQVRIRPDDSCVPWILWRADWLSFPEPPRVARWDVHFENKWDVYLTGLDLSVDTGGETKQIVVEVDGVIQNDPETGFTYYPVTANGRRVVHLTLPWIRGHVLRFYAIDDFKGLLYDHRWHTEVEPSEQKNWNQPFTILGTQADKWLKAVIFEADTFGEDKTVRVEVDGTVVTTLIVNADGRRVVQIALPQALGRVWRFFPIDHHPSRLYSLRPVFDEEPFQLDRWETQEINHGYAEFQSVIEAQVTLKSSTDVTLTLSTYVNQLGTIVTDEYTIPSTSGIKLTRYVPFVARKGVLFKYLFTCDEAFWLYGGESHVVGELWTSGRTFQNKPFGDDDADPTRDMVNTTLAAARSGGSA